jgi:hypothetical protein
MKRQLRTRVSLLKPSIGTREEYHQQNMRINYDKGHYNVRKFQIVGKVQVKYTVQTGKWKLLPGSIHKVMGPLIYLVRVGNHTRYCHCYHLLSSKADIPKERPNVNINSSVVSKSAPSQADGTVLTGTAEDTPPWDVTILVSEVLPKDRLKKFKSVICELNVNLEFFVLNCLSLLTG